jgi:ABC-type transporter Mla MlaB component
MTLRIEKISEGERTTLRLSGPIHSEHLEELKAQIRRNRSPIALDLADVTLVDVGAVRFLSACEAEGINLLHCASFIRAWISRERHHGK